MSILKPAKGSRHGWRLKWQDPDSGREKREAIPAPACNTVEGRAQNAADKSQWLADRKRDLAIGRDKPRTGVTIAAMVDRFFLNEGADLAKATKRLYRMAGDHLAQWAATKGVATCDDLTTEGLLDYRGWLTRQPVWGRAKGKGVGAVRRMPGRKPAIASVNNRLRATARILIHARLAGLLPVALDDGQIRASLKQFRNRAPEPRVLARDEVRQLLKAALAHDGARFVATRSELRGEGEPGTSYRHPKPVAPFVAFLLLNGCRYGEALTLAWDGTAKPWGRVDVHAADHDGRAVGECVVWDAKRKRWRKLWLEHSPATRALLAALQLQAGPDARGNRPVFDLTLGEAKTAIERLWKDYGAPKVTPQWFRRTAGSFLTCAPGIFQAASAFRSADLLGHSVQVAEKHYIDAVRGIPRDVRTLEDAYGCGALFREVVASVRPGRKTRPGRLVAVA